ncbi:phage/plasmid primase, P4 family [Enterococcus durans]|uniref:phage/plasmid primase, P4 family n=1 Tax=Enterococcus durans TaxID=53345 RepID=UPI0035D8A94C
MRYKHIPDELRQLKQWCVYRLIWDDKRQKHTKIPIDPFTGLNGKSNDESTWSDYQTALSAIDKYDCQGLGFYFKAPYFGIDIDDIEGEVQRYIQGDIETNMVYEFVHSMASYAEYSQSGNGIHIISKGKLPGKRRRKGNVEMYDSGRFFVMTGNIVNEQFAEINEAPKTTLKLLYSRYIGDDKIIPFNNQNATINQIDLSESEIIEKALQSKQGPKFKVFLNGGWEAFYDSQSEADIAFANILAFWTGRDFEKMDSIFRQSDLMREKYDERRPPDSTYGANLLNKAIHECENTYNPSNKNGFQIFVKEFEEKKEEKYFSYDDTGNAERFMNVYGTLARYSYINKRFYYYDGKYWQTDNTGEIPKMIDNVVDIIKNEKVLIPEDCDDPEKIEEAFRKHVKRSRGNAGKKAMKEQIMHRMPVLPEEFDSDITLMNTQNGYLNLVDGALHEHDINKMFTRISNIEYTDKIDAPQWEEFLNQIFDNDKELIRYVQKAVGYSLTGSTREQCMFVLFGAGSNGKSVFLDTISHIMGSYATNMQADTIMIKGPSGGANTDIARLKGARLVTSSEPNEGVRMDEGLVKQLTGGDKVTARFLYGEEFEFTPEFKLWLATNHKPIIRGTDDGIWRRMNLIPFTIQIPDHKKDKNLKHKLKRESIGILNWIVEGCLLWQREGLKRPKIVEEASKEYREEMDVTSAFVNDCCELAIGAKVSARELFQAYKTWADDNGQYSMSSTKFGKEMGNKFNKRKSDGLIVYEGIKLNDESTPYLNQGIHKLFSK